MEFSLFYRGRLGSNKGKAIKQELRRFFHIQLLEFWLQNPLNDYRYLWDRTIRNQQGQTIDISCDVGPFRFVPLVNEYMYLVADLQIKLLRPEPPGSVTAQSGDLDNRVKTLLDALRVPRNINELPRGDAPRRNENPFFCLLEDDALIHSFSVETHRWLEPNIPRNEVILLITVRTSITRLMARNAELGGNVI